MWSFFTDFIKDLFFPKWCASCGKFGSFLCPECYNQLIFINQPIQLSSDIKYLDRVFSAVELNQPIRKTIHALKYQSVKEIGITLARLLYFTTNLPRTDFITAVPLHKHRQQERGFNQAEVIAQEYARLTKTAYLPLISRVVNSKHQASLEHKEDRLHHLANHFQLLVRHDQIKNKSILIIDDVCTTGSTLSECAKVIKVAHPKSIFGCTIAHGV